MRSRLVAAAFLLLLLAVRRSEEQRGPAADGLHSLVTQLASNQDLQSLTYCRISTRDLISTAQSTASRLLQGVCNPRELKDQFRTLEKQLGDQFNVLKTMVLNLEDKQRDHDKQVLRQYRQLHRTLISSSRPLGRRARSRKGLPPMVPPVPSPTPHDPPTLSPSSQSEGVHEEVVDDDYGLEYYTDEDPVAVSASDYQDPKDSVRYQEVASYNSSIHQEEGRRVFSYYWRVPDISYRMKNWGWRRSLRSDSFYIFEDGYRMYIRIYPNKEGRNVHIHVGLTRGDFDANLEWPFKLKHKILVLDHSPKPEDLSSRVWDPTKLCSGWNWRRPDTDNFECVGLGFTQQVLSQRDYIHADSIVIRLVIFLD